MKKNNKKGFTLAELLIVVAIIAVLVAISIPVFTTQLEKAREATDAANIRAAYAEVSADAITNEGSTMSKDVTATQKDGSGWVISIDSIGGQTVSASTTGWTVAADGSGSVTITAK